MNGLSGRAPWFSLEASADEITVIAHLPIPSEKEVCKCLSCPYADCRNCIGKRKDSFKPPHRPPIYDETIIRRLIDEGKTSREISVTVGCAERTAKRYIRKFVKSA